MGVRVNLATWRCMLTRRLRGKTAVLFMGYHRDRCDDGRYGDAAADRFFYWAICDEK